MVRNKRAVKTYTYKCNLSGATFKTHREAKNPQDLMSVDAYYEMHPDKDDRPEVERIKRKQEMEAEAKMRALLGDAEGLEEGANTLEE